MPAAVQPADGTVEVNGLNLHYLDWGGDAPVAALALHGFALNCHSWDEVAPRLRDRLRLRAIDQRGHGLSDWAQRPEDYDRDTMVRDATGIMEALALERPVLLGHSMGGIVAMTVAAQRAQAVRALVLADVGPEVNLDGAEAVRRFVAGPYELESLDAWVEHTHRYYPWRSQERLRERLALPLRETAEGTLAKQFDRRFREAGFRGISRSDEDLWATARRLRCPTLLLRGGESPVLSQEQAQRFADAIDVVRLVTIAGAGHSVAGDRPDEFVQAVREFLDDVLEGEGKEV